MHHFRYLIFIILLFLSPRLKAENFCAGLERLMRSSTTGFKGLNMKWSLEGIGIGRADTPEANMSVWVKEISFPTVDVAMAKFDKISAHLTTCSMIGASLKMTSYNDNLDPLERIKKAAWRFEEGGFPSAAYVSMDIWEHDGEYLLRFAVTNIDTKKIFTKATKRPAK